MDVEAVEEERRIRFDIAQLDVLPGTIGYMDLPGWGESSAGYDAMVAALRFLEPTDAIIIDLRRNARCGTVSAVRGHDRVSRALRVAALAVAVITALAPAARAQGQSASLPGEWRGAIRGPAGSWAVSLDVATDSAGLRATVDFPDASAYRRTFTTARLDTLVELTRPNAAGGPMSFVGRVVGDSFSGVWTGYSHQAPFVLRRTPGQRAQYREVPVTFYNDSVRLAGTLYVPQTEGRHRAIVCVHGSGPVDRSIYTGKAAYLASRGTATLIYDKRGTGQSTGDWQTASAEDLAGDALAGVRLLRQRREIDSARVGLEGFSQGGWIVPLAASRSRTVAFVITGSAAGINPADQSVYDVAHQLAAAGFDSIAVGRASALRRAMYASATDSLGRVALDARLATARTEPWFKTAALPESVGHAAPSPGEIAFLRLDPSPIWQMVRVPVLAYWGSRDTRVPPDSSLAIVRAALTRGSNRDVVFHTFPGADHNMILASAVPADGWDFPRTAPYLELIADWLSHH
jgi:dienelactone hydrolase